MWLKFIKNFIKLTQINAEQEFRSSFIVVPHPFPCKSISIFSSSCPSIRQSVGNGKLQCYLLRNHSKYWHKSKMDLSRQVSRMQWGILIYFRRVQFSLKRVENPPKLHKNSKNSDMVTKGRTKNQHFLNFFIKYDQKWHGMSFP